MSTIFLLYIEAKLKLSGSRLLQLGEFLELAMHCGSPSHNSSTSLKTAESGDAKKRKFPEASLEPVEEDHAQRPRLSPGDGSSAKDAEAERKRKADAASLGSPRDDTQRPRVDVAAGVSAVQAPAKPLELWKHFETDPAGSPIHVITKQVAPYVEHMIHEKMKRCVFFSLAACTHPFIQILQTFVGQVNWPTKFANQIVQDKWPQKLTTNIGQQKWPWGQQN